MDAGGGGSGQSAVPQVAELGAARVGVELAAGGGEDLFGLHIKKTQAHGAVAHDAFEMAAAAAAAVVFPLVEGDDGMAALPDAFGEGVGTIADAGAEGPNADTLVELAVFGGKSGRHGVGVIGNNDRGWNTLRGELLAEHFTDACAFDLW